MNFYELTLETLIQVLTDSSEDLKASYLSDCLSRWKSRSDVDYFIRGFSDKGVFADFHFANSTFSSEEQRFWTQQLFGGLVAMAMQLARFHKEKKPISIGFIRQNFGHQAEVIHGTVCQDCGARLVNALDIDRYITMPVISEAIVEGLDHDDLKKRAAEVMALTYPRLGSEREKAKLRAANTNITVSSDRKPQTMCFRCGSKNLKTNRFLKSLRKNEFVMLSK